jgi:hypothetical protein
MVELSLVPAVHLLFNADLPSARSVDMSSPCRNNEKVTLHAVNS